MNWVTIEDEGLVLGRMLGVDVELLRLAMNGRLYEPELRKLLAEVEGLPAEVRRRVLGEELSDLDEEHDLLGTAIWLLTGGLAALPLLAEDHRQMALLLRERCVPTRASLNASYETEAGQARELRALVIRHEEKLKASPVAPGLTWFDVLDAFVRVKEQMADRLAQRAELELQSRARAGALRSEIMSMLARLRGALTDEVAFNPELPRDLVTRLFAFQDQVAENRRRRGKRSGGGGAGEGGAGGEPPVPA